MSGKQVSLHLFGIMSDGVSSNTITHQIDLLAAQAGFHPELLWVQVARAAGRPRS